MWWTASNPLWQRNVTAGANAMHYYTGLRKVNSSDIHDSEITLQHPGSTVNPSSCPSNREGFEDSLGGSGLSFLLFFASRMSSRNLAGSYQRRVIPRFSCSFASARNRFRYERTTSHQFIGRQRLFRRRLSRWIKNVKRQ